MELVKSFIHGVSSGEMIACKEVKQAVNRHLRDLERQRTDDFPYYFDDSEAERAIKIVSIMRHTKGKYKGDRFNLQGWQAFIYWVVYGWKRVDNDNRRFRKAYIEIARKNGKTEMMAPAGLLGLLFDKEGGAEIYTAATKKDQANILFNAAKVMGKYLKADSDSIDDLLTVQMHSIFVKETDSKMISVGADHNTMDGFNPHVAVIDEYHAHKDDGVLKIMETGMGAREQPLLWVITTAGFNRHGPCYHLRTVGKEILEDIKQDESFFCIIFTLDEDDDWEDENNWIKANPGLGVTPTLEYMRAAFKKAKNEGESSRVQFLTKNLNVWVDAAKTWIPSEAWRACRTSLGDLEGRKCYGGLDLSSVSDFSSYALLFPPERDGEKFKVLFRTFCPEDTVRIKADSVGNYRKWKENLELIATPGNVIDYDTIQNYIISDAERFDFRFMGFDRYNSANIVPKLIEQGIPMEGFGQGYVSMSEPTKQLEKMVLGGEIEHNSGDLLEWCLGNVELVYDNSPAANCKPTKKQTDAKIDPIVALIMAIGTYNIKKDQESAEINIFMV